MFPRRTSPPATGRAGDRRRLVLSGAAFVAVWFAAPHVTAADLPGARVFVERAQSAADCPAESDLAEELRARMSESPRPSAIPVEIRVVLEGDAEVRTARVTVSGRKHGERTLRTAGPTCDALRDALIVLCLLLLDEDPRAERRAPPAETARPRRAPEPSETEPRVVPHFHLEISAAGTHGLPYGLGGAFGGALGVSFSRWELVAGGFWAPSREVVFGPGRIALRLAAAKLDGCYAVLALEPGWLKLNACGMASLGVLTAKPDGYARTRPRTRPLWLVGGGFKPRISLASSPLSAGATLAVLAPLHEEGFSIDGLPGRAYATDDVVVWAGLDLNWRVW